MRTKLKNLKPHTGPHPKRWWAVRLQADNEADLLAAVQATIDRLGGDLFDSTYGALHGPDHFGPDQVGGLAGDGVRKLPGGRLEARVTGPCNCDPGCEHEGMLTA